MLQKDNKSCIAEKGLDFSKLEMVTDLEESTLESCMDHCLHHSPEHTHVLVGFGRR